MFLIFCPHCRASRSEEEFHYQGEAHVVRPQAPRSCSDEEWGIYLYFRTNPRGLHREMWSHSMGCGRFFNVVRNTSTDQILKVYKVNEKRPDLTDFENTLKSPSGEPIVGSGNFAVKK